MKTTLKTDFIDVYDHHFDLMLEPEPHNEFLRMSKTSLSRGKALDYLRMNGFDTVHYGIIPMMKTRLNPEDLVVVYLDEYSHQGVGKDLMTLDMAEQFYPDALVSEYMSAFPSMSMRDLFIGSRKIRLMYQSDHDWKSNVGNVEIRLYSYDYVDNRPFHNYPMTAIDYVFDEDKKHYAIDFNTAPLIKHSPVTEIMSPHAIVYEIKSWYERNSR